MRALLDFFPLLAFFVAFYKADIYVAVAALMIASVIQVAVFWLWQRRVDKMPLVNMGVALIFGGLTLWLRDERFIKLKPTVFLWLFAAFLLGRQWLGGTPPVKSLLLAISKEPMPLPDPIWRHINQVWGLSMFAMGALNLGIAFTLPLAVWVNFKVWGLLVINACVMVYTSIVIQKHLRIAEQAAPRASGEPPPENS
jgi:intracellular septation protein